MPARGGGQKERKVAVNTQVMHKNESENNKGSLISLFILLTVFVSALFFLGTGHNVNVDLNEEHEVVAVSLRTRIRDIQNVSAGASVGYHSYCPEEDVLYLNRGHVAGIEEDGMYRIVRYDGNVVTVYGNQIVYTYDYFWRNE